MATQWGRKETIIWPPHVPMLSYTAVATALLCTCLFVWQRFAFSMTPLQRSYMTEYIRSQVGATFNAHEGYRLLYLGGGKSKPRLAFPVDFVPGKTALPDGKTMPVALSELASLQGFRWFYRGPEQKLPDVSLHRWLRQTVYEDEGLLRLFAVALIKRAPQSSQPPQQDEQQPTRTLAEDQVLDATTEHETVVRQQYDLGLQTPSDEPHHEIHTGIF